MIYFTRCPRSFASNAVERRMPATLIRQGKVRDIYDLGDRLLLVASDRISAFDWVFPTAIPDKGRVLTQISRFWFEHFDVENHLISCDVDPADVPEGQDPEWFAGRSMVVKKCEVVPVECVARGFVVGSGWKEYQRDGAICGIDLPPGLQHCEQLPEPIFTPATKEDEGHDENIPFQRMVEITGQQRAEELRQRTLDIYRKAAEFARPRGIILADTKLEWGELDGRLILIDEVLTPDSSRFWPAETYEPGRIQPSYDKQYVRDYLETTTWDKNSPAPELPAEIVAKTREKYITAYETLTGNDFPWK